MIPALIGLQRGGKAGAPRQVPQTRGSVPVTAEDTYLQLGDTSLVAYVERRPSHTAADSSQYTTRPVWDRSNAPHQPTATTTCAADRLVTIPCEAGLVSLLDMMLCVADPVSLLDMMLCVAG